MMNTGAMHCCGSAGRLLFLQRAARLGPRCYCLSGKRELHAVWLQCRPPPKLPPRLSAGLLGAPIAAGRARKTSALVS